ncbi:2-amino-4-hydroxy-6-hydroxymethyldihydropteridine diphosphokinase [Hyphococcus formosus]|uniref:2-amino-4-hydroxy-6- hydroxymethyldihydropteridine diphosphokinase n=1 Tax=Hyphococcus formosus TaxID=3143534 RepID=UPI00398B898D
MLLIAIGSSLPVSGLDSQQIVTRALKAIERFAHIVAVSSLYESPAWPDPSDPAFVNAAAQIETDLSPEALLAALHAVEAGFGRVRSRKNGPRTLDLDLLAYNEERFDGANGGLVLPHPRIAERAFVLVPLAEIAPDWIEPNSGKTVKALLAGLETAEIRLIS